jgi:hypothetical protein
VQIKRSRVAIALSLAACLLAPALAHATTVSGSLTAGGELSGPAEIDFTLDPSTTYTGTITVDGAPLVNATITQGSAHLVLDTTKLHDGSHSAIVTVSANGSTTTIWSGTIETDNAPRGGSPTVTGAPTVGSTLTASPGSWSPAPTSITYQWERCTTAICAPVPGATTATYALTAIDTDAEIEVVVSAADANGTTLATSPPTPAITLASAASATATATAATPPCTTPDLTASLDGHASQTVALGQGATLAGELRCAGSPLAGATVQLAISSADASPTYTTVQTAADGSFSYALAGGPSRDITLTYSPSEGQPAAATTVSLRVKPRITLRITPRATTNHHTITFSGRVLGGHIARGGLPLQLEYREGDRWMIYTDVLASTDGGHFTYRYTFERTTVAITYTFRVAIPATGVAGYPFAPVASAPRSVRVTP